MNTAADKEAKEKMMSEMGKTVYEILRQHKLQNTETEDGEGLPLVDALVPPEGNFEEGVDELEFLEEHICDELIRRGWRKVSHE
jgi:hypothetical protein